METLKNMIVNKSHEGTSITESYCYDLILKTGKLCFSDLFCNFGKSYNELNPSFQEGAILKVFTGYRFSEDQECNECVYVRIQIANGDIVNFEPVMRDGRDFPGWDDWEADDSQFGGENYTGFCDKLEMEKLGENIWPSSGSNFDSFNEILEEARLTADDNSHLITAYNANFGTAYSSNAETTLFYAKNKNEQIVSLILDLGVLEQRTF